MCLKHDVCLGLGTVEFRLESDIPRELLDSLILISKSKLPNSALSRRLSVSIRRDAVEVFLEGFDRAMIDVVM